MQSCAFAMRCLVLTYSVLSSCYAMSGTDISYAPTRPAACGPPASHLHLAKQYKVPISTSPCSHFTMPSSVAAHHATPCPDLTWCISEPVGGSRPEFTPTTSPGSVPDLATHRYAICPVPIRWTMHLLRYIGY
eukprot:2098646-Rhodomonas_salina.2